MSKSRAESLSEEPIVGSVAELWRFPVKSMQGEQLQEVEFTARGVVGDRAYALIDTETGKVASAKNVRLFPGLLACRAAFVAPPQAEREAPPVRIDLSSSKSVTSDSSDIDRTLSAHFRREVRLAQVAPDDFAALGQESPVPVGAFFDVFPLSLMTTSTLARLNELRPQSRFEPRRFRMNVIVSTDRPGFVENDWVGFALGLGDEVRIDVALLDPRCVMTTLAQEDLPQDPEVLRTLGRHNRMRVGDLGRFPCAGVYAVVAAPGTVRTGSHVTVV